MLSNGNINKLIQVIRQGFNDYKHMRNEILKT